MIEFRAFETLNAYNEIRNPVFIAARFGDDTPDRYVVPAEQADAYLASFNALEGCHAEPIAAEAAFALAEKGYWFGIKVASAGGVAAWARAALVRIEA